MFFPYHTSHLSAGFIGVFNEHLKASENASTLDNVPITLKLNKKRLLCYINSIKKVAYITFERCN